MARDSFDVIKQLACDAKASRKRVRPIVWSLWPRGERVERKGRRAGACIPSRAAGAMMNGAVRCPRGRGRCGSFAPRTESPDKRSPSASPSWHIPPAIIYTRLFSCCLFFLSFSSKIFHSPPFPFVPLLRVPWLPFPSRPDTFTSVIQDSRRAIPAILSGRHKVEVLTPAIHLKVRCQRSAVALTEIASAALTATSILSFSPTRPCCMSHFCRASSDSHVRVRPFYPTFLAH